MAGPLAGTRLDIDDAVDEILVGSDPDCRLSLDLPGVSPIHARIWRDLGGVTVYDTRSPRGLYVNDTRVTDQASLRDGDVLWLGEPGDPDSVMLQCRLPEEGLLGAPVGESEPAAAPAPVADADLLDGLVDAPDAEPVPEAEAQAAPLAAPAVLLDEPPETSTETVMFRPGDIVIPDAPPPSPVAPPAAPPAPAPPPAWPAETAADAAWAQEAQPALPPLPPVDLDALVGEPVEPVPPVEPAEPAEAMEPIEPMEALETVETAPASTESLVDPAPLELADAWEAPPTKIGTAQVEDLVAPDDGPDTAFFTDEAAIPPVPPPTPRPMAAVPVPAATPAPPTRAVIDDTRPRAESRPARPGRPSGPPEGLMDWARSSATDPAEAPAPAPRSMPPAPVARTRGGSSRRGLLLPVAAVLLIAAAAGGYFLWTASQTPKVASVSPARARVGETLTVTGSHLGDSPGGVAVTIGGRPAKVLQAAGTRLQVEVPEVPTTAGRDTALPVVIAVSGRSSAPATVGVFQSPRLRAIAPEVGMPGDEVVLSGTALESGVSVAFGAAAAQVVQAGGGSIRVRVPAIAGAPGTEVPVVATMGADKSNPVAFVLGRVPLVTGIDVRNAAPGELVTVSGRGFDLQPAANRVTVGGMPALVVSSTAREIKAVVPRLPAGESALRVSVAGSENVGESPLAIDPGDDPIRFRFVAEPFADAPGHEHAVLSTGLGPAFVLSTGAGKSAAERAYEAQRKLNDAAQVFASSREADVRAQFEPAPALYLYGRNIHLLDVTEADAAAYEEDWTKARTRGGAVTPARLAVWWEAVARDLVLLLVRGEKPQHAAALAAEGRTLADLHDAARRTVSVGVPAALVGDGRTSYRDALRAVALRVPATVSAPAGSAAAAPAEEGAPAPAAESVPPLRLDGTWTGVETEGGAPKSIQVSFRGTGGTLTYQRRLAMSVPVVNAGQPQKGAVRFEIPTGGGRRYYRGRWDGAKITGKLYADAEARREAGTFELEPAQ